MSIYKNDINVSLNIGANTQQAQQQIQALQASLNKLSSAGIGSNIAPNIQKAAAAAQELQMHLQKAYNTKTGNLDLSLLNRSLATSKEGIQGLSTSLINAGQDGQAAFVNLAKSIASANQPMLKANTLLGNMWTTLKNTARWQISSSILQGFMGSIQKAYGYAQDLNKSLTDIRIVTGYGADKMKDFAVEANNAAKALSTTTNEYAKASLIYFQQGLNDQEVKERTDVTVKMANVTRDSAQVVSDQMTAIWNNFDDGSKSLEYYADVITALGAATASSTDEIAEGLEKFAAVASTVGLSYEYATSALATITAETRQSADVVGTALKTLFARIQGLSLGETLDDGTDLNKYSEALAKVGISIKDQNGGLKDMDTLLEEMAAKWQTLNKDQQVALAQTVAGVRQYTQLVALMDNWDVMQTNLNTAANSEGTLDEQQDIYAESWEAASKRAKAALEEIYTTLLDDTFFIKLTNAFADLTSGIGEFIKGFGGVKSIILSISSLLLMAFSNKVPGALESLRYNISVLFGGAAKEAEKFKNQMNAVIDSAMVSDKLTSNQMAQVKSAQALLNIRNQYSKVESSLNQSEQAYYSTKIASLEHQQQEIDELILKTENYQNALNAPLQRGTVNQNRFDREFESYSANAVNQEKFGNQFYQIEQAARESAEKAKNAWVNGISSLKNKELYAPIINEFKNLEHSLSLTKTAGKNFEDLRHNALALRLTFADGSKEAEIFSRRINDIRSAKGPEELEKILKEIREEIGKGSSGMKEMQGLVKGFTGTSNFLNLDNALKSVKNNTELVKKKLIELQQAANNLNFAHIATKSEVFSKMAGSISSFGFSLQSLNSAIKTLQNPDITGWEKFLSVLTSVSFGLPMLFSSIKGTVDAFGMGTLAVQAHTMALQANITTEEAGNQIKATKAAISLFNASASKEETEAELANTLQTTLNIQETTAQTLAKKLAGDTSRKHAFDLTLENLRVQLNTLLHERSAIANTADAATKEALDLKIKQLTLDMDKLIAVQMGLNASMLPWLIVAGLAIAAIAAIVIGIKKWKEENPTLEEQLKRQNEELEKATDRANAAKEAYENLKNTITNYEDAVKSLEELTEGTKEFEEALKKANAEARKLIEEYNIEGAYINEQGLLVFPEESLDNAESQAGRTADARIGAQYYEQNESNILQSKVDKENVISNFANDAEKASGVSAEKIVDNYDEIKKLVKNNEEITGEMLKQILSPNTSNDDLHFYENLAQWFEETGKSGLDANDTRINEIEQKLEDSSQALLMAQESLEDWDVFQSSEFQNTLADTYSNAFIEAMDIALTDIETWTTSKLENTLIEQGYEKGEYDEETGKTTWTTPAGEKVSFDISDIKNEVAAILAEISAKEDTADKQQYMEDLSKSNPLLAAAIEAASAGNQNSLTFEQQVKLQKYGSADNYIRSQGYNSADEYSAATGQDFSDLDTFFKTLDPYSGLKEAYEQSVLQNQSDYNAFEGGDLELSDESFNGNEAYKQLEDLYAGMNEEERQFMISGKVDLTTSPEEIKQQVKELVEEAKIEDIFKETAEATGWSEEAIKAYAESLESLNPLLQGNKLAAAQAAQQHLNFAKGAQDATKILEEQADALKKADEGSMEYQEAIAKLTASLNQMFGSKVSANFLKNEKNFKNFEKAIKGDTKAIQELRKEISKDFVAQLEVEGREEAANAFDSLFNEISKLEGSHEVVIGTILESQGLDAAIAKINELAELGKISAQEINTALNGIGYSGEIEMVEKTSDPVTQKISLSVPAIPEIDFPGVDITGDMTMEGATYEFPMLNPDSITKTATAASLSSAAKSNPAPSSGGGGGGGGGEELKDPKNYEDEIERYHENTRALERLERALDKVTTAKDRAFGKERLRLIEEEIAATEKLAAQQKSYLAEIEGYAAIDRSRMEAYGFTFDEYGEITNYNDVYRQQVDKFNASRTDAAEEEYNKFKETVEQYEETITLLDEEQMKYQEYLNSLVDLKLEKITTEVEVKIRVNDIELTRLEYMLKKLQREGAAAADEIKNIADQINETMEKAGPIQEAIDKIYEQARAEGRGLTAEETAEIQGFYADGVIDAQEQARVNAIYAKADEEDRMLTQAEEDQIQEYKEQLLELNEEIWELADAIEGKLAEELDELGAEFDENLNRLTSYTQMYENLQNVLELTGKSKTAEGLNALNQLAASTLKNSTNALKANKANYDTFVELAAEANRHLQEAIEVGDKHMIDYWTEQVEDVTIRMEEAHVAMLESFNDALEAAGNLFDTKVENMITKLKKDLGDLDTMVELYDRAVELENLYLSSNQSIYELSKLSRDIGKSIEDTSNLIAKNKLGDLMKEINKLRAEGVQLSKYDLEYLQAKYELELAEIALQEAQEAKSQVKLTRNSEGGWGYVYTADSEKIAEAEQNFEDKTYNMQQLNADYIADYSEQLLKNRQEMTEALANIDKTREDYDAEVLRVKEEYMAKEEFYVSELTKAYERQGIAYEETILGMISNDESLLKSHENFKDRTLEIIDEELIPAHEEWLDNVQDICDEAGYSYDELTDGVLENMDSVNEASAELTEKTLQEQENMRESMKETMQEIKNWQKQYLETIDAMVAANEAYYEKTIADYGNAMDEIVETAQRAFDAIVDAARAAAAALAALGAEAVEENVPNQEDPSTETTYTATIYSKDGTVLAEFTGPSKEIALDQAQGYKQTQLTKAEKAKEEGKQGASQTIKEWQGTSIMVSGATGMYTGSWGPEGKLAILHEKELVLNKTDTKNMLDMVNTLRDIDWRAKLNELWNNIEDQFINPVFGGTEELLQQVHIEANFPDLKDHFEIEEAFHNLINTASQYANRKNI